MWARRIALSALLIGGICEVFATTPWIDWDQLTDWLAVPVTIKGFPAFLLLFGFIGNAAMGAAMLAVLWRSSGWPCWQAALAASPFWIVFYRTCPKPW